MSPPFELRQVRDFSTVLSHTFNFLRQHFKGLIRCLIFIAGPFIVFSAFGSIYFQREMGPTPGIFDLFGLEFIISIAINYFSIAVIGMVVYEYMLIYADTGQETIEIDEVWRAVKKDFIYLCLTYAGLAVLLAIGYLLIIIPGIYLSVVVPMIPFIRIKERGTFFASIARSRALISGYWWVTLGILLVLFMIQMVFSMVIALPYTILELVIIFTSGATSNAITEYPVVASIFLILSSFNQLTFAIANIGIVLHYFSLVERKEAVSLIEQVDRMGDSEV